MKHNLLALGGAIIGGTVGLVGFQWLLAQGLYGLILPGGSAGIGASFTKNRSIFVAILCGLFALALGVFAEWLEFPFAKDQSLRFFVEHLFSLRTVTLLMIALGGAIGFWCPFRRLERPVNQEPRE